MLKMDKAKAARLAKTKNDNIELKKNQALKFSEFKRITPITSTEALDALILKLKSDPKEVAAALRDQIRARKHVYGVPMYDLPYLSAKKGSTEASEMARFVEFFRVSLLTEVLPAKKNSPAPYPVRSAPVAPSALALSLDRIHMEAISEAWKQLVPLLDKQLAFKAPPKARPAADAAAVAVGPPKQRRRREPRAAPKARAPSAAETALEGEEFEEDGINWKVLSVRWSEIVSEVVVYYYDILEAEEGEVSEEDMLEAVSGGCSLDCLEYSTVREIRAWIGGKAK